MVSHNAMAANSDSDLIIQTRLQNRIDCVRRADAAEDLLVRRGFTDRDSLQCLPHAYLQWRFLGDREGGSRLAGASRWP
jgi:hypothetical protein